MIRVNRIGNIISGSVNGVPYSVTYSDSKFQLMKELEEKALFAKNIEELRFLVAEFNILIQENYADFIETKSPYIKVNHVNNKFYLQYEGVISNKAMPNSFGTRIIRAAEKGLEVLPIIKNWVRFLHNPNYSDSKAQRYSDYISAPYIDQSQVTNLMRNKGVNELMAIEFSTTTQVAMTMEGLLVCYKASKEITSEYGEKQRLPPAKRTVLDEESGLIIYDDKEYAEDRIFEPPQMEKGGDAFYCGTYLGHIIQVGKVHYLPRWEQINCDDHTSGAPGLHVGGLRYIRGYQTKGTMTHNILVDPMHIGAIVGLEGGDDGAMRVKQYFVLNAFGGVNNTLYNSSRYAKLTDAEYGSMIRGAVKV